MASGFRISGGQRLEAMDRFKDYQASQNFLAGVLLGSAGLEQYDAGFCRGVEVPWLLRPGNANHR